jgi:hypothetical protein
VASSASFQRWLCIQGCSASTGREVIYRASRNHCMQPSCSPLVMSPSASPLRLPALTQVAASSPARPLRHLCLQAGKQPAVSHHRRSSSRSRPRQRLGISSSFFPFSLHRGW